MTGRHGHAMVDIESWGGGPGGAIASIGAVRFDPNGWTDEPPTVEDFKDQFYVNIDLSSSLEKGFRVDGETIEWWMRQSEDARKALFNPQPVTAVVGMGLFGNWVMNVKYLWAAPVSFDIAMLEAACRLLHPRKTYIPWSWKGVRDCRTLFDNVPGYWPRAPYKFGIEHHALHDAIAQVRGVQWAYKLLAEGRHKPWIEPSSDIQPSENPSTGTE